MPGEGGLPAKKRLKLGLIMEGPGRMWGDWRHPEAQPDAMTDIGFFAEQAKLCEAAKFDFLFLADGVSITSKSAPYSLSRFEPLTLMSALAMVTRHIGLVGTVSSSFTEPYNVARQFASLDQISQGRAGWNLVTSFTDGSASNFGQAKLEDHDIRYRRGAEHLNVVQGLWDSWEEDAFLYDKPTGRFFEESKLHRLDHQGEFYAVAGPLSVKRSPQGQPVIFQAGASETGRAFAARHAEVIFVAPENMQASCDFYRDVKARAAAFGRDPGSLLVAPGLGAFIGADPVQAETRFSEKADLVEPAHALAWLSKFFDQHDFAQHDLSGPIPDTLFERYGNNFQGAVFRIKAMAAQGMSIMQIAKRMAAPRGDFIGTPAQVADRCEEWLEAGACDAFMVAETLPGQLRMFAESVVPILQQRGVFRTEYEGQTLRQNLGLSCPKNRYT